MGLDGPAHLAEEIPEPKKSLPRVMLMVIISQFVVGLVWIIVLGFSITDLTAITNTTTGYSIPPSSYHWFWLIKSYRIPILELIRIATGSNAAAILFCLLLIVNNGTSALGSGLTMSRQGYAFARDGGLFWNAKWVWLQFLTSHTYIFWGTTKPTQF